MITKKPYGRMPDGRPVTAYTLENASGASATVLDLGATMVSLYVPDRDGRLTDVLLGYDSAEGYLEGGEYIGATVGRFAGRIAYAKFRLDGKEHRLTVNDGEHSLHGGGTMSFSLWDVKEDGENALILTYVSPEGENGYPGTLTVNLRLSFDDKNELKFDYTATSDKPTICNLTNHAYYNLGGLRRDVLGHELWLNSEVYSATDSELIPVAEEPVEGTPYDFRTPKKIGRAIYDNNFMLRGGSGAQATVYDPDTGIFMEMFTDAPAVVVYTSVMLPDQADKGGKRHSVGAGICLETEVPPNAPNCERYKDYPYIIRPGQTWKTWTTYRFSVR